jgi:hypothetical protein
MYAILFSPIRTILTAHLIILDFTTRIVFGDEYRTALLVWKINVSINKCVEEKRVIIYCNTQTDA